MILSPDTITFVSKNRIKIDWTSGPNDESVSDTVVGYNQNLLKRSDEFDHASWGQNFGPPILTPGTHAGPYSIHREVSAWSVEDNLGGAQAGIGQRLIVPNDLVSRTGSIYVRKTTGALTHYPAVEMAYSGGVATTGAVVVDTTNGTLMNKVGGIPDNSWIVDAGDYWLVSVMHSNSGTGNTILDFLCYAAANADGTGTYAVAAMGTTVFFRGQVIQAAAPVTPQPTMDLDGTYTNLTLTTGGLVERGWMFSTAAVAGTDYGTIIDNGDDWIRVGGDASGEGALATVVLAAPEKFMHVVINGVPVADSPVDAADETIEVSIPDAFAIELHELPIGVPLAPAEIAYSQRPFVLWSAVEDVVKYCIYRQAPDDAEDRFYQFEWNVDGQQLYEVQVTGELVDDGPGWNWFRVEVKTEEARFSARDPWPYFVKALPGRPTNAAAIGTSPNISITLTV